MQTISVRGSGITAHLIIILLIKITLDSNGPGVQVTLQGLLQECLLERKSVTILFSLADYSSDFLPGYTDNNGRPHGQDDPLYRVYKLILGVNDPDRANWPNVLLGNSD